ncbi:ABC transporter permease [Algoriphagus terrigena]|uniref:ABC transporter permease n=1 Tax=Algoriphagus terrigena TaxID=344884 RepID=UPI001FDFB0C8|nr:hypothetical protein [Algoriphagus terrigena]
MWKNYLKIAWRNLLRSKAFSLINIGGLALGLACCMLILLYHRRSEFRPLSAAGSGALPDQGDVFIRSGYFDDSKYQCDSRTDLQDGDP